MTDFFGNVLFHYATNLCLLLLKSRPSCLYILLIKETSVSKCVIATSIVLVPVFSFMCKHLMSMLHHHEYTQFKTRQTPVYKRSRTRYANANP